MIDYKAQLMVEVPSYNSTVECSRCGNKVPKSLAIRTHVCPVCGLILHRDHNSSLVVFHRGLEKMLGAPQVPQELRELTPVEILMGSMKQEAHAFRRG